MQQLLEGGCCSNHSLGCIQGEGGGWNAVAAVLLLGPDDYCCPWRRTCRYGPPAGGALRLDSKHEGSALVPVVVVVVGGTRRGTVAGSSSSSSFVGLRAIIAAHLSVFMFVLGGAGLAPPLAIKSPRNRFGVAVLCAKASQAPSGCKKEGAMPPLQSTRRSS